MAEKAAQQQQAGAVETTEASSFLNLLKGDIKTKTSEANEVVDDAVRIIAREALSNTSLISQDAVKTIEAMIAAIDKKLTDQVNKIIHHEEFQALEGSWRGLHHLVSRTETDEMMKIKVFNISKKELHKTLQKFSGASWDQSPIFKKIYRDGYSTWGADIFGSLVGDYHFDHSAPDVMILREMSQIAAASHAPFIAGADPGVMGLESWTQLMDPKDIAAKFSGPEHAAWRSLRESDDSKYIGLTMPRFLARAPYSAKENPVDEFDFEEEHEGGSHGHYCWANAAYAMGANINKAFKLYGWCTRIRGIESGGTVEGLATHAFKAEDGKTTMKCPTETAIDDRREAELSKAGFLPLVYKKNSDYAAFIGAQSLQKPTEYDNPDATASANLSARLPYLFASCRFAHYLKCIVRDKIGSFKERADMQRWLQNWVNQYVEPSPESASEEQKALKPLAAAGVNVTEIEGNPGYYAAKFHLRPHYQLEGLKVSLSLVARVPSGK